MQYPLNANQITNTNKKLKWISNPEYEYIYTYKELYIYRCQSKRFPLCTYKFLPS